MREIINWKSFFILSAACVAGSILVMPFQIALTPALAEIDAKLLYLSAFLQGLIIFSPVVFLGLLLAQKRGFGLRIANYKHALISSMLWGVLGGVLVILFSLLFWEVSLELLKAELAVPMRAGFLAGFYGDIAEEVLFRLFLTSLFVWILMKMRLSRPIAIWTTIIVTNVAFGLGHLGMTGEITDITADVVLRAVLLNSACGIIFGWLYCKKDLESAMVAHFSTDMVLHVIAPFVTRLFI